MASRHAESTGFDWRRGVLEIFALNEAVNQHLLAHLHPALWRIDAPGYRDKCIATTFAHMHNCRLMWLKMSDPSIARPATLDRRRVTVKQARSALAASARAFLQLLERGTRHPQGRVRRMQPHVIGAMTYLATHEAHHRGQVMLWARQLGRPLELEAMAGMWQWGKLSRELEIDS